MRVLIFNCWPETVFRGISHEMGLIALNFLTSASGIKFTLDPVSISALKKVLPLLIWIIGKVDVAEKAEKEFCVDWRGFGPKSLICLVNAGPCSLNVANHCLFSFPCNFLLPFAAYCSRNILVYYLHFRSRF